MSISSRDIPVPIRTFWQTFDKICYRHDYARVYSDFVTMLLTQFTPPGDLVNKWHEEAMRPYDEKEKGLLNDCYYEFFKAWVKESEDGCYDFLGTLYESITSGYKSSKLGQFFTPQDLCSITAQLLGKPDKQNAWVSDPTCGSGRMFLSFHDFYKDTDPIYLGEDLDPICAKMTAVNMAIHGLRGEVICHDALCEMDSIRFGFHVNSLTHYRILNIPHIVPIESGESLVIKKNEQWLNSLLNEGKTVKQAKEQMKQEKSQQLNLFS